MNYTREQAEEVFNDYAKSNLSWVNFINAKFPTIEVGKWYKNTEHSDCLILITKVGENHFEDLGFNLGEWVNYQNKTSKNFIKRGWIPATDQEVLNRLTEEAKKRYKVGDRVMNVVGKHTIIGRKEEQPVSQFLNGYFIYEGVYVLDLSKGEWADVVESNPIQDKIERLERELAELKQLINK